MRTKQHGQWVDLLPFLMPLIFGGFAVKGLIDGLVFNVATRCIGSGSNRSVGAYGTHGCLDVSTYRYPVFVQHAIDVDWGVLAISVVIFYGIYVLWSRGRK